MNSYNHHSCCNCKSKSKKFLYKSKDNRITKNDNTFDIYQCINCQIIYCLPILSDEELSQYYKSDQYYFTNNIHNLKSRKFEKYYKIIKDKYLNPNVLDFGCGDLKLLSYLRERNINCHGYDNNKSIYNLNYYNFFKDNVLIGDIEKLEKINNKFDVIILNQVIEHIQEPLKLFQILSNIICDEGIIIIETPNTNCIQFKLFRENAIHLDSPRHRILYNKKNLSEIAEKYQFKKIITNSGFNKFDYPLSFFKSLNSRLKSNEITFFEKLKLGFNSFFIYIYYQFFAKNHQSFGLILKKN